MSMVISLVGEPKSGKTDWSLTAEKPIKHFEFDLGGFDRVKWRYTEPISKGLITTQVFQAEGAVEESDKYIALQMLKNQIANDFSKATKVTAPDLMGWKELWYTFLTQYVEDMTNEKYKTIVIDSATNLWPICHKALLQEKQEITRRDSGGLRTRERLLSIEYGEANDRFLPLIQAAREMKVNLIVVHHTTEERQDQMVAGELQSVATGRTVFAGWKHMRKWVDLEVWFEMGRFPANVIDPSFEVKGVIPSIPSTKTTIEISGMHRDAIGMTFFDSNYSTIVNAMRLLRGEELVNM